MLASLLGKHNILKYVIEGSADLNKVVKTLGREQSALQLLQ